MADIFISYSRKDKDFVRRLDEALKNRGREAWVDWEDIRPTEEWMQAIYGAIEGADTFVFVLTPNSVASVVCGREIAHAAAHNKRMVPIVARDVNAGTAPEALAKLNYIFFRESDDFEKAADTLISALDTDLDWVRAHTRLLTRAIDWESKGKNNSFVLRGDDLRAAERWLAEASTNKEPKPTALQTEYIIASRKVATRRQQVTLGAVTFGFLVAIVLAIVAFFARQEAVNQKGKAIAGRSRADDVIHFVQDDLPDKLRPIGRLDLMEDVAVKVDRYYSQMEKAEGESVDTLLGKFWVLVNQGNIAADKGRSDEALAKYRSAVQLAEKAQRVDPRSDKALYDLASAQIVVAIQLSQKPEGGIDEISKARETLEKLTARDPSNALWQSQLATSYGVEAIGLLGQGQSDAALASYRKAYAIQENLVAEAPNDSKRLSELATAHSNIGRVLFQQLQFDAALDEYHASQEILRKLTQIDPRNADWQRALAWTYKNIGETLQGQGQIANALDEFRKYSASMDTVAAIDPANAVWHREAAEAHCFIAVTLFARNELEEARNEFRRCHAAMTRFAQDDPTNAEIQVTAASVCAQLALANVALNEKGEASEVVQQGLAILVELEKGEPLPPSGIQTRKSLEQLQRALPKVAPASTNANNNKLPVTNQPEREEPSLFVEDFVRSLAANDLDTQLRHYADRAEYYEFGPVSKEVIRKDLKHDITRWPSRIYSMPNPPSVTADGSDFVAEFPMTYTLTNPKGAHSGVLQMTLRLRPQAQTWQIVGIQKEVIRAK
jgi:tetratricopeptide (TPR) repeat protein